MPFASCLKPTQQRSGYNGIFASCSGLGGHQSSVMEGAAGGQTTKRSKTLVVFIHGAQKRVILLCLGTTMGIYTHRRTL
jgi:hypothetical protein